MIHARDVANTFTVPPRFAYLQGCGRCQQGRIWAEGHSLATARELAPAHTTLPFVLLLAYTRGLYACCDCEAGQSAARVNEKAEADWEEEQRTTLNAVNEAKQRRLERIFAAAQVPPRFADLTLRGFYHLAGHDPGKQAAIARIREYYDKGRCDTPTGQRHGILLYGRSDMGKTGALCPLFMHYIRAGQPGLWVQYNDLLAALKDFESGQVEERIAAAKNVEYLFVDDFGDPAADKAATDYTRDVVFRILDHRNNTMRPTFITSNLAPERMTGQFHERIVKRLGELCAIVEVTGTPMRDLMDAARKEAR